MLVIFVILAVIVFVLYTVIKVSISEWTEESDMSRLSLNRRRKFSCQDTACSSMMKPSLSDAIEISDDDSTDSSENMEVSAVLSAQHESVPLSDTTVRSDKSNSRRRRRKNSLNKTIRIDNGPHAFVLPDMPLPPVGNMKKKAPFKPKENVFEVVKKFNESEDNYACEPLVSTVFEPDEKKPRGLFFWNQATANKHNLPQTEDSDSDSCDDYESKWKVKRNQIAFSKVKDERIEPTNSHHDRISKFTEKQVKQSIIPAEVIPQHEIIIAGVKVKLPVKPYPCQIAVMNMLIQGCTKQQNCLLESPTGSGKTLALLCGVLAWQDHYSAEMEKERAKIDSEQSAMCQSQYSCVKDEIPDENGSQCNAGPAWKFDKMGSMFAKSDENMFDETFDDLFDHFGKLANLKVPKIYYGTRTHRQIEQVVKELGKTSYRHKKMTILSSREHTCIQESKKNKTELCNELLDPTKFKKCPFYTENNKRSLGSYDALKNYGIEASWDIEDLVSLGKDLGVCPYFAARTLMADADIIFCPYNYLLDPDIRDSMQIQLKNEVIILDEAHNIEDICRDAASTSFRWDYLGMSAQECERLSQRRTSDSETYSTITNYFRQLMTLLNEQSLQAIDDGKDILSSPCWNGQELMELFDMHDIGEKTFPTLLAAGKAAILDYNKAKEDVRSVLKGNSLPVISQTTKRMLEHLTFALQMLTSENFVNDYRACITENTVNDFLFVEDDVWISTRKNTQRVRTLKLICMNPAMIFAPLALSARSIILASGTLTPTSSFQSELGTKFAHTLSANHVIPKDQVYVRCIPRGPTGVALKANYQNVNSWGFQDELGKLLLDVCRSVPHGVLCFFSSYQVMHTQIKRWKHSSCWDEIERVKRVFLEPRYTNQLADTMREYRETIEETSDEPLDGVTGALLFAVFRGKVAEGIDFSDNEARCVLAIGIPYAVRLDPAVDMKFKYNDMNVSKGLLKGSDWYSVQAFRALNQALGRCVRHKNDWGAVLLVDERFLMPCNVHYLPKWIKSMWNESKRYDLREELQQFAARQRKRESGKTSTG